MRSEKHIIPQRLDPALASPHVNLGILYIEDRDFERAEDELIVALHLNNSDRLVRIELGQAYEGEDDYPRALEEYNSAIIENQGPSDAYLDKAKLLLKTAKVNPLQVDVEKLRDACRTLISGFNAANGPAKDFGALIHFRALIHKVDDELRRLATSMSDEQCSAP